MPASDPFSDLPRPLIIAHRGSSAAYPENTPASFLAAVSAGAPMLELDVTLSRDRKPVVIHDETVDRTTSGRGLVSALSLSELKKLDAGSWFHPRFYRERIPTLNEVLDAVGRLIRINIEIKPEAYENISNNSGAKSSGGIPNDVIEQQVVSLARSRDLIQRVIISSFEPRVLLRIARMENPPPLALLTETALTEKTLDLLRRIRATAWHTAASVLTPEQVATARQAGFRVLAYTVNDPAELDRLLEMGVDGVFSDYPTRAALEKSACRRGCETRDDKPGPADRAAAHHTRV